jgi:hypothetical protein
MDADFLEVEVAIGLEVEVKVVDGFGHRALRWWGRYM